MKVEIGSQEWLEMRRSFITATDAACIMGLNPYETALQRYHAKVNGTVKERNSAMQRGIDLEPEALRCFESGTGHMVRSEWRVHPDIKWMAATFDGINDEGIAVEIKCPGEKDHLISLHGNVPEHYMPQLQHQMKVAEIGQMYYFSYRPEHAIQFSLLRVTADKAFQLQMMEKEQEFYTCLVNKTPPPPSDRDVVLRENRSFLMNEEALYSIRQRRKKLDEEEAIIKKALIEECEGQASRGYRLKIVPVEVEGMVDYRSIPSIKEMNLDEFRKPNSIQWRVYDI